MKQCNPDIGGALNDELQRYSTRVSFDSIWEKHERENRKHFSMKKAMLLPIVVLLSVFTVGFASYGIIRIADNIDYPFADDQRVIGKWESVDFVDEIEQFKPDKRVYSDELYLTELAFIDGGDTLIGFEGESLSNGAFTWTKGMILDEVSRTASNYEIKEIDGNIYMFFEWKSGDYTIRGMKPGYYVLKKIDSQKYTKKVDSQKYTKIAAPVIREKIAYPFIDDRRVIGSWQSVDLIEAVDGFVPGVKSWPGDLYLARFDIMENGKLDAATTSENAPEYILTWTKGLILDMQNKTAKRYQIKVLDGEAYMFYEWISGGASEPWYFVFKKV